MPEITNQSKSDYAISPEERGGLLISRVKGYISENPLFYDIKERELHDLEKELQEKGINIRDYKMFHDLVGDEGENLKGYDTPDQDIEKVIVKLIEKAEDLKRER